MGMPSCQICKGQGTLHYTRAHALISLDARRTGGALRCVCLHIHPLASSVNSVVQRTSCMATGKPAPYSGGLKVIGTGA